MNNLEQEAGDRSLNPNIQKKDISGSKAFLDLVKIAGIRELERMKDCIIDEIWKREFEEKVKQNEH